MLGPLTRLRAVGLCCPCLESEMDRSARSGCVALSNVPVKMYRKVRAPCPSESTTTDIDTNTNTEGKGILDGISQGINQMGLSLPCSLSSEWTTTHVGIAATLDVLDTDDGPAIRITPRCSSAIYHFVDEDDSSTGGKRRPAPKTVLFRDVGSIAAGDGLLEAASKIAGGVTCGVKVFSRSFGPANALLQFDVLEAAIHGVSRDEVTRHLNTILIWNRQRMEAKALCGDMTADDNQYVMIEEGSKRSIGNGKKVGGQSSPERRANSAELT